MRLITLFFLVISIQAYSQDTLNNETENLMRWRIGVVISPDLCYRTLKNNGAGSSGDSFIKELNKREIPKAGYTAGFSVCYDLTKHWTVETGLLFSNKGYRTKMLDVTDGYIYPHDPLLNDISKYGSVYSYYYLDIPLKIDYFFGQGKIRFCGTLGVTANIFLDAKEKDILKYTDGHVEKRNNHDDNKYNEGVSPMAGFGFDWLMNKRMALKMEPTFRYGVIRINDGFITSCLWNAGLNIGFYYSIR